MNKIEKAFEKNKRKKSSKIRKWWHKNGYIVARILLFYIWIPYTLYDKYKNKKYNNLKYNDETTKKYLDRVLPDLAVYCDEGPNLILISNADDYDYGGIDFLYDFCSSWMRKKHKKEKEYFTKFNYELQDYIIKSYQIKGYNKMCLLNWTDWDKAAEKFGWYDTPWHSDYAKGVVFYKDEAVENGE